jgi:hypothetical protein
MGNIVLSNDTFTMNKIEVMKEALRFSEIMAQSDIIPTHYRGKPANVFIAMQTAFRTNLDPMQVMQNTFIVSGKLGMSSTFAISLANSSGLFEGGIRYRIEGAGDDLKVTAYANLKKSGAEISYTISMREAQAENWTKNPKYRTLPELMLRYRSATLLIRTHVPEVINGMHMVEEIEDIQIAKNITPKTESLNSKLDSLISAPNLESNDHVEKLEVQSSEKLEELGALVLKHNISDKTISKWCDKAGVSSINELDNKKIESCISYINTEYSYSEKIDELVA